jgi:hypothetical protein
MDLKLISKITTWGNAASDINRNFSIVKEVIESSTKEQSLALGLFRSLEDLENAYPDPERGVWAYVGTSFPANIYTWNGTSWILGENPEQPDKVVLEDYIQSEEVHSPSEILR